MKKVPRNFYPLGKGLFARVRNRKKQCQIHIAHYRAPSDVKGGRVRATQRAIVLEMKGFKMLMNIADKLIVDFEREQAEQLRRKMEVRQKRVEKQQKRQKTKSQSHFWTKLEAEACADETTRGPSSTTTATTTTTVPVDALIQKELLDEPMNLSQSPWVFSVSNSGSDDGEGGGGGRGEHAEPAEKKVGVACL